MIPVKRRDETQYNTFSALKVKKVYEFFNTLGVETVSESTIGRLTRFLDFTPRQPIPLGEIQKIYLLVVLSKLYGFTYDHTVDKFFVKVTKEMIDGYWSDSAYNGNLDKATFNDKLLEFYHLNH